MKCQSNPSSPKDIGRSSPGKTRGWRYGWTRRRRWITNKIRTEKIRSALRRAWSLSISTIRHLPLIWLWFMIQQHRVCWINNMPLVYLRTIVGSTSNLTDFILDNSRRLLVWCLMRPAVRGVCPMPGLACSRCVSQLNVLVMADLPALRLRN